jgi:hypothetical protein
MHERLEEAYCEITLLWLSTCYSGLYGVRSTGTELQQTSYSVPYGPPYLLTEYLPDIGPDPRGLKGCMIIARQGVEIRIQGLVGSFWSLPLKGYTVLVFCTNRTAQVQAG